VRIVAYAILGLMITLVAVTWVVDTQNEAVYSVDKTAVPHFQTAIESRRSITTDAVVSKSEDHVLVQIVSGTIPADVTRLTVVTDENCQPDQHGVSHCLNRVAYQSAQGIGEAVLRHNHRMTEVPCLAPGETVVLVS